MATKVLVPRLGEGVDEVTVTKWLKQAGDSINEFEPLLEVESDKVTVEVPAPASGVILKIEAQEGQAAKVGELLAIIGAVGEVVGESVKSIEVSKVSKCRKCQRKSKQNLLRHNPLRNTQHATLTSASFLPSWQRSPPSMA